MLYVEKEENTYCDCDSVTDGGLFCFGVFFNNIRYYKLSCFPGIFIIIFIIIIIIFMMMKIIR